MATRAFRIVLQNPLGQKHHDDALAAALGVPDDAALLLTDVLLASFGAKILMHTGQLLPTTVEYHEVPHQFDQPILATDFE